MFVPKTMSAPEIKEKNIEKINTSIVWFYGMIVLESCILPIPPDPFFIFQALKNPKKVWSLALICTLLSTLGGCIMYGIGVWFYEHFRSFFMFICRGEDNFSHVQSLMHRWGALAIIAKSFTPVPYKVMALISGVTRFSFFLFAITSFLGRGLRFFGVAFFVHRYHDQANRILNQYRQKYHPWLKYALYSGVAIVVTFLIIAFFQCLVFSPHLLFRAFHIL